MVDFFLKLFKAFNSSQTPWQMSLALSMGMAMGLTPYSGIQTIALIFLAFIINIHIGLFLVSSAFFAGIAFIADPYFEQIGFALLNNEALKDFFTFAYNSGLFRLTYFNNTIVIGSSVVAFGLLLPMFLVLNKMVYAYRDVIASRLQKYAIFRKLGIEVSGKKDRLFRIWGIALFGVLGGAVAVFGIFFLDTIAKGMIEENLGKVLDKKVSIEKLDISFTEAKINLDNLNISDSKKVVLHTQDIDFDIDFNQILFQRYHIENINVAGMTFNTPLKAEASEAQKVAPKASSKVQETKSVDTQESDDQEEKKFKLPSLSLEEPKHLVDRVGLSSLSNYEDAQKEIDTIKQTYKEALEKDFSKDEIDEINSDIKNIQAKIKSKDLKAVVELKKDINLLKQKLKDKKNRLNALKKQFNEDKKSIQKHYKDLKAGALSDYDNLQSQYTFDKDGGVNVVGAIFGDKIKKYLSSSLEYYEMIKPYIKSEEEEKEVTPPRGEGRWIKFKDHSASVDFWIKKINISGMASEQAFSAVVKDISSDQKILKKEMTFKYLSDGTKFKNMKFDGKDSHLKEKPSTVVQYSMQEAKIANEDLGFMKLEKAKYSFDGAFVADDYFELNSKTTILFTSTTLTLKKTDSNFMKSLQDVLNEINAFDLKVKIDGTVTNPNISVKSDLDNKLSGAFTKVFEKEIQKYKKELKELIDNRVKDKLQELGVKEKELAQFDELFSGKISSADILESRIDNLDKELKDKANNELKKQKERLQKELDDKKAEAQKKLKDAADKKKLEAEKKKKEAKEKADKKKKEAEEKAKKEADKLIKSFGF